jgi:hypothetical protein
LGSKRSKNKITINVTIIFPELLIFHLIILSIRIITLIH